MCNDAKNETSGRQDPINLLLHVIKKCPNNMCLKKAAGVKTVGNEQ